MAAGQPSSAVRSATTSSRAAVVGAASADGGAHLGLSSGRADRGPHRVACPEQRGDELRADIAGRAGHQDRAHRSSPRRSRAASTRRCFLSPGRRCRRGRGRPTAPLSLADTPAGRAGRRSRPRYARRGAAADRAARPRSRAAGVEVGLVGAHVLDAHADGAKTGQCLERVQVVGAVPAMSAVLVALDRSDQPDLLVVAQRRLAQARCAVTRLGW